ncbi:MAG TPA: HAD family hydrolase [Anaerolineae bacterium]|nr:HAD family hydrolase [Anaerolineae bacterium]
MIKGIIFDLGGTLLRFTEDWDSIPRAGALAMADWYLKKKRIKVDAERLVDTFLTARLAAWALAGQNHTEVTIEETLQQVLDKIEAPASTKAFAEAAIKVFYEHEEAAWQPFPDAIDTLKVLKGEGYRLGLFSNATNDKLVQRLINRHSLRPLLSPTFSSAAWGWRKPKPEPFQLIAERWRLPAAEIVVVGDTLSADILGAHNAGMKGILATMDEAPSNADHRHLRPDATISQLAELPEVLRRFGK